MEPKERLVSWLIHTRPGDMPITGHSGRIMNPMFTAAASYPAW